MNPPPGSSSAAIADLAPAAFDDRPLHQLYGIASAVNRTKGRFTLYLYAGLIVVVIMATAAAQVRLNSWNEPFYNAIERRAMGAFIDQLVVFFVIAGVLLVLNVSQTGLNQAIRLKLRELATTDLIGNWMTQKRAARISRAGEIGINPDQRIHQDAQHLADLSTDLGVGLLQSSLLLLSFIGVLWGLSRGLVFHFGGSSFTIPGYMVWAALLYAATGSWLSWMIGRPLVKLSATRYAQEASFRIALVRTAEQADGIALNAGEAAEERRLNSELNNVIAVLRRIVMATVRLTTVTAAYGWVALVFPIIVAAPAYFGGSLTFGELMMVVGAFTQLQLSLRWFVDNAGTIADWRATLLRVMSFRQALTDLDAAETGLEAIERTEAADGHLRLDDLAIMSLRGRSVLSEPHIDVKPGERVLIVGQPGAGKSTLFLAIAGLWGWGSGHIDVPPAGDIVYLSQQPYLPHGSLREVLSPSDREPAFADSEMQGVLRRVGLDHLHDSLDRTERWERELSHDEQRRLALARTILQHPAWVVSDEAFNLTDPSTRDCIVSVFSKELAETAVISISGSASADGFFSRVFKLNADQQPRGSMRTG